MNTTTNQKKFLRFRHAAIKRYGEKQWTALNGYIEFNPNYTVSVSKCEVGNFGDDHDTPYIVELSNGTKFLCFLHEFGDMPEDMVMSEAGEEATSYAAEANYEKVKQNIHKLNGGWTYAKR